jgi:small subunit ribosomal protein S7
MRNTKVKKREVLPDPKFGSVTVHRFVNRLMYDGKKSTAYGAFYDAMIIVEKKIAGQASPLEVFETALGNVMPMVEVRPRRVGGATFQIPTEVRPNRRFALGSKWLIEYSRKRNEKTMSERLAAEILAASRGEGAAVKKRDDIHKMAESNKAFSHFRF